MARINPYLNFPGNTEEAFNFYRSVFGGEFSAVMRWSEMPDTEKLPEDARDKIMHIALPMGNGNYLAGTDDLESMGSTHVAGNNFHIVCEAENKDQADSLFGKLSDGGSVTMPMQDAFWGDYFGMCTDRFGIQWMLIYEYPKQS